MSAVLTTQSVIEVVDGGIVEQYIRKMSEEGYTVKCKRIVTNYICERKKL